MRFFALQHIQWFRSLGVILLGAALSFTPVSTKEVLETTDAEKEVVLTLSTRFKAYSNVELFKINKKVVGHGHTLAVYDLDGFTSAKAFRKLYLLFSSLKLLE